MNMSFKEFFSGPSGKWLIFLGVLEALVVIYELFGSTV